MPGFSRHFFLHRMIRLAQLHIITLFLLWGTKVSFAQDSIPQMPRYIVIDTTKPQMLPEIRVLEKPILETKKMERRYTRLVRDVKKTLPYARQISEIVLAVNDTLLTIESEKAQKKYLKSKEDELMSKFDKQMRKLTLRQGMLLIKLVDRECSQTSYELVKMYRGGLTAFFWQSFARVMGANLKDEFDPAGEDYMIEYVIYMVEHGLI